MAEKYHHLSVDICDTLPLQRTSEDQDGSDEPLFAPAMNSFFPELDRWELMLKSNGRSARCKRILYVVAVIVAIGMAFGLAALFAWIALKSDVRHHKHGHFISSPVPVSMDEDSWLSCGDTPQEARALGCVFDVMLSSWVHSECHNQTYMDSYVSRVQFPWFRDRNMTEPVSEEEVRLGEYDTLYCYQDFHYEHCMYMWRVQMNAWKEGRPIDSGSWNLGHSEHCAQLMLNPKLEYPK